MRLICPSCQAAIAPEGWLVRVLKAVVSKKTGKKLS